jgi:hypothetical protein
MIFGIITITMSHFVVEEWHGQSLKPRNPFEEHFNIRRMEYNMRARHVKMVLSGRGGGSLEIPLL